MTNYRRNFDSLLWALFGRVGEGQIDSGTEDEREHFELNSKQLMKWVKFLNVKVAFT